MQSLLRYLNNGVQTLNNETPCRWEFTPAQIEGTTVKQPIYSGLFVHGTDEAAFVRTVNMALEGGASGVSVFSVDGMNEAKWKALRKITESKS